MLHDIGRRYVFRAHARMNRRIWRAKFLIRVFPAHRVPEESAEDLGRSAQELRTRQRHEPTYAAPEWRTISPSAELLIDPECQARGISRDTRARGADRFHWSVVVPEQSHTAAAGHTGNIARARSLAEVALRAYVGDWRELSVEQGGDG